MIHDENVNLILYVCSFVQGCFAESASAESTPPSDMKPQAPPGSRLPWGFHEILSNGGIRGRSYESPRTGLRIVQADVDGPLVNGYMALSTEAHDDDGLPHTLEHLVFMGSEAYPYKGVLDLISNRCLSSGTNAWTDTDNTWCESTQYGFTCQILGLLFLSIQLHHDHRGQRGLPQHASCVH